jgi:hypothetical protein
MVAIGRDPSQVDPVRSRNYRPPLLGLRRIGFGDAEVHMIVVGVDPLFAVRGIVMILTGWLAA